MKDIQSQAMLVKLTIKQWSARKYDKAVTKKADADFKAQDKSGRFNKMLMDCKELDELSQVAGEARSEHYRLTLPWFDEGSRILPTTTFFQYTKKMTEYQGKFDESARSFINKYPDLKEEAKNFLGNMFSEDDYPASILLKDKFQFKTFVYPIPSSGDFRVQMVNGQIDTIKAEIDQRVADQLQVATKDCFDRAYSVVKAMVDRLSEEDPKFKNSLVQNVKDVVEILPSLNITGDQALTRTIEDIRSKLCIYDPQTLRDVPAVRQDAVADGRDILEIIDQYRS